MPQPADEYRLVIVGLRKDLFTAGTLATLGLLGWPYGLTGCGDPVPDASIDALGPEDPNVPPGSSHRPGQPCLLCHREGGRAQSFSIAGTVYENVTSSKTIGGVSVSILDSARATHAVQTNCAGNFFVRTGDYVPTYPYWVTLRAGSVRREMASPSYREGSCGACHTNPRSATSSGRVYLIEDPTTESPPAGGCPR